jgi:hypothetical protein
MVTAFPSVEERLQVTKELDMPARSAQTCLAHTVLIQYLCLHRVYNL